MNAKNNKRKRDPVRKIKGAFMDLASAKPVGEITVTDIRLRANVNRTTFYANFENLAALRRHVVHLMETEFEAMGRSQEKMPDFRWLFEYIREHPTSFKFYLDVCTSDGFPDEVSGSYQLVFFKHGLRSVIEQWFKNGCLESATEMNDIVLPHYSALFADTIVF